MQKVVDGQCEYSPNEIRYGVCPWGRKSDMLFKRLWRKANIKAKEQMALIDFKV